MEKILIEKSFRGPAINFDAESGLIEIEGHSILENPKVFYEPLVEDWLENYIENPSDSTIVNIKLEYFNTSSSMWIFQILKKLKKLYDKNKQLSINWYYFDEDMCEVGEDYQTLLSVPFHLIEIPTEESV